MLTQCSHSEAHRNAFAPWEAVDFISIRKLSQPPSHHPSPTRFFRKSSESLIQYYIDSLYYITYNAIVLAVVSREQEGTYGYKITQDVRKVLNVSESTMYPVLRRLQKDECLEVYDMQFDGRNRRYYKVTEKGMAQLNLYKVEWKNYTRKITEMFEGGAAE